MNIRFFITFIGSLFLLRMSSYANPELTEIWNNPHPILKRIATLIPEGNYQSQEKGALAPELQSLAYAISQAILAADSPSMLSPTQERKDVIRKWAEILAPYTDQLVPLALDPKSYRTHAGGQSRSLLDYAPATEAFAQQVRPYLEGPNDVPLDASRLLYEHRLLREQDKIILSTRYQTISEFEEQGRWAGSLAEIGILDGLQYAGRALRAEPNSKDPDLFIDSYGAALRVLGKLGPAAGSLQPDLEYRIANLGVFGKAYESHFRHACEVISGKKQPEYPIAVNGSGWLDSNRAPISTGEQKTNNQPAQQPPEARSVPLPKAENTRRPSSNISIFIFPAGAVGVAILAFIVKVLKTR